MKLYFCRLRDDPKWYLHCLRSNGKDYVKTGVFSEAAFTAVKADMQATALKYPELEVCCFEGKVSAVGG